MDKDDKFLFSIAALGVALILGMGACTVFGNSLHQCVTNKCTYTGPSNGGANAEKCECPDE